ncbi:hypothetical protein GQ457_08G031140 [Hibiscus cannabinus]
MAPKHPNGLKRLEGVVLQDHDGILLGACCKMCPHIASSFVVEAQAAAYGLQLALELAFHHVILEDDSLAITSKLKLEKDDLSEISAFIWDAKHLSRSFASCWLQFTPREGIHVAHAMARGWSNSSFGSIWVNETPEHIATVVAKDRRRRFSP